VHEERQLVRRAQVWIVELCAHRAVFPSLTPHHARKHVQSYPTASAERLAAPLA